MNHRRSNVKKLSIVLVALAVAWPLLAATRTAAFEVTGWTCGSCASATRIALKKFDGVEDVKTDHETKEVLVTYDDSKVTTDRLVQAIARLGYKATVKATAASSASSPSPQAGRPADAPVSSERVSFFEVPLECGAAESLGCGSASKPVLKALERNPRVKEAKINYAGTVLAVVWNDPELASSGASTVEAAFKTRDLEATLLRGPARDRALKEYGSDRWYGAAEVDRLSEREAEVIAARLVNRAKARLGACSGEARSVDQGPVRRHRHNPDQGQGRGMRQGPVRRADQDRQQAPESAATGRASQGGGTWSGSLAG